MVLLFLVFVNQWECSFTVWPALLHLIHLTFLQQGKLQKRTSETGDVTVATSLILSTATDNILQRVQLLLWRWMSPFSDFHYHLLSSFRVFADKSTSSMQNYDWSVWCSTIPFLQQLAASTNHWLAVRRYSFFPTNQMLAEVSNWSLGLWGRNLLCTLILYNTLYTA